MRKIIVSEDIFELYDELHLGVVICENISNNNVNSTRTLLDENIFKRKQALAELDKLADLKVVKEWRNAYKKFKEKKNRSSIESYKLSESLSQ